MLQLILLSALYLWMSMVAATPLQIETSKQALLKRQYIESLTLKSALLEDAHNYNEALNVTAEAINEALTIAAEDILLLEEYRRGRLYRAKGEAERALAAWRRAVFYLDNIRSDLTLEDQAGRSTFNEIISPLYRSMTDLLLQQATRNPNTDAQLLLLEARDIYERLKASEMEDYLGDTCAVETKPMVNLENIAPRTAVLYPILLPDRLEILLSIGNQQYQTTVPVTLATIETAAYNFETALRTPPAAFNMHTAQSELNTLANQFFTWLIAPVQSHLNTGKIDTLVIVPDGPLRLFPFAALMNKDTFLIEQYAIVTAPSLTLMEPESLARTNVRALVAGMSRPGPVIDEYAIEFLGAAENLVPGFDPRGVGGVRLPKCDINNEQMNTSKIQACLKDPKFRQQLEDSLTLPGVEKEIVDVSNTLNTDPIINNQFVLDRFSHDMERSWQVVHIASHGFFGGTPDKSFIMTYDHFLKMDQLGTLIKSNNETSPELLVLSACQTAAGNDRAPLGITGAAIKSGARSAIGSLWSVSDKATQLLLREFYQRLNDKSITKAKALQQAQLTILRDNKMHHPFFWSPFILIGNWL